VGSSLIPQEQALGRGKPLTAVHFEGMDRELLTKLFLCYIQWCIGQLPNDDRIQLEEMTPILQVQFGCFGQWYEVMEEGCGLPPSGREILRDARHEMRAEVSAKDFVTGFATGFLERMSRANKRAPQSASGRRQQKH
jgi:hypothetical protein